MASYGVRITTALPAAGSVQWDGPLGDVINAIIDVVAARVGVDGLDVNGTLDVQGHEIANALDVRFTTGGDPGVANSIFINSSGELCVRDSSNRLVQVTSGGVVNVTGSGGFGGDYVSTNQGGASYTNSTTTYTFTASGGTVYATIEAGAYRIHNGSSTGYVGLAASSGIGSTQYTLTFPSALPAGQHSLLEVDATGGLNYRLSASFTQYLNAARGIAAVTIGTVSYTTFGGWSVGGGGGGTVDYEIPYVAGDRIDSIAVGKITGFPLSCSLNFIGDDGAQARIARISFNDNTAGLHVMQAGATTLTGTLPYTPPGTGSLVLSVSTDNSVSFNSVRVVGLRKIIS